MNPEDQVEETQEEVVEELVEEVVEEDAPVPVVPVVPTLDDRIVEGSATIQAKVAAFRASKTAQHDAQMALAAANAAIKAADGAEDAALADANAAIDEQIVNLNSLKSTLNG